MLVVGTYIDTDIVQVDTLHQILRQGIAEGNIADFQIIAFHQITGRGGVCTGFVTKYETWHQCLITGLLPTVFIHIARRVLHSGRTGLLIITEVVTEYLAAKRIIQLERKVKTVKIQRRG